MISTAVGAGGDPNGTGWIRSGSLAELEVITTFPLPDVPAQWLRQRWQRQDSRWLAHSRRILNDPTYLALHRWTTLAFSSQPGEWSTIAGALVAYAHRVASGEISVEELHGRVLRSLRSSRRDEVLSAGGGRRLQNRYHITDRLVSNEVFTHMADSAPARPAPTVEPSVIAWLAAAIGPGWLTAAAREVLGDGMDLAAEFVASSSERAERAGLEALLAAHPSRNISPSHRITHVLGHLPRPARDALRCFVLGPTDRSGVGGPANSVIVWAASRRHPSSAPAALVAVWRYHAAMLDPDIAQVASQRREPRDRLRRFATRPGQGPLDVDELLRPSRRGQPDPAATVTVRCGPGVTRK
jgi:hypothetical protein